MKQFSYANTYSAYLSAVLLTFCCTTALHPRGNSVCKPASYVAFNKVELPTCSEDKKCLKPLFNKQTEKVIAACQEQLAESCDQRITVSSPTTITQSGHYCLLTDLDVTNGSVITIAPDVTNVILDLNDHVVSGTTSSALIDVLGGNVGVAIVGGVVRPLGSSTVGIRFQNASDVTLNGLSLEGNNDSTGQQRGVLFSLVTDAKIENCSLTQIGFRALELNSCTTGKVNCCQLFRNITQNSAIVQVSAGSNNIVFDNVSCSDNEASQLGLDTSCFEVRDSSNISFWQCSANNNINRRVAFRAVASTDCLYKNCQAKVNSLAMQGAPDDIYSFLGESSSQRIVWDSCITADIQGQIANGFFLSEVNDCVILNCSAESVLGSSDSNGVGFNNEVGNTRRNNYFFNNIAITNGVGFRSFSDQLSVFLSNYAAFNDGDNYEGFDTAPVAVYNRTSFQFTSPTPFPSVWYNVSVQ